MLMEAAEQPQWLKRAPSFPVISAGQRFEKIQYLFSRVDIEINAYKFILKNNTRKPSGNQDIHDKDTEDYECQEHQKNANA